MGGWGLNTFNGTKFSPYNRQQPVKFTGAYMYLMVPNQNLFSWSNHHTHTLSLTLHHNTLPITLYYNSNWNNICLTSLIPLLSKYNRCVCPGNTTQSPTIPWHNEKWHDTINCFSTPALCFDMPSVNVHNYIMYYISFKNLLKLSRDCHVAMDSQHQNITNASIN